MNYGLAGGVGPVNASSHGLGRGIAQALAAEGVRLIL
jgi:short-subunit dehydrogenase